MYLRPFHNNRPDYDFSLVYDTIKKYYPINQKRRFTSEKFMSTAGFKKMQRLMNKQFVDQGAYKKWEKIIVGLKKELKKPIATYPAISSPSLFCQVTLSKLTEDDFIREKSLNFYISMLGPFFSIQGVDHSTARLPLDLGNGINERGIYAATHAITVSPVFEYAEPFNALEEALRTALPGYLFVPYQIGMSTIKNISTSDDNWDLLAMDTIYEGLFGSGPVHNALTRGDEHYGLNDWLKPLNKKEKKLLNVIAGHVGRSTNDKTLHKVWKIVDKKPVDTFLRIGNITVIVELFDVLDLTDKSKIIAISEKRGAPFTNRYQIKDGIIEIRAGYSFRVVELTENSLTLRLVLSIKNGKASMKGEVVELQFIQMKKLK